jgi:SAM-dependent methyltransferase
VNRFRRRRLERTAELWGEGAREKVETQDWQLRYWQSHPVTERHIMRRISGGGDDEWIAFTKERYGGRRHGFSLGCGNGVVERRAIVKGLCERWDAADLSGEAIAIAEEEARRAGLAERIRYSVADLNVIELPERTYDLVIAGQSLHHVEALEHVLDAIAASLTDDGVFIVQEYVGPARFQMDERAVELVNRMLAVLPESLLIDPESGLARRRFERPRARNVAAVDPSEAIRSDEIVALVEERFEIDYRADFGGTLLHLGLGGIIANFDPEDEKDVALLELMCLLEDTLIDEGVLASDFTYIGARRRR